MKHRIVSLLSCLLLLTLTTGCGSEDFSNVLESITSAPGISEPAQKAPLDNNAQSSDTSNQTNGQTLTIHYIDVGQGDAELLICGDDAMLIDGGDPTESSKMYSYLQSYNIGHLDYVVATHAHSDHIGGLPGALQYATVDTAFCPVTSYDSKAFENFAAALSKQGAGITVPSVGESFSLGSAKVDILGPVSIDNVENPNNTSIVLMVTFGSNKFLFTGDAEREEEQDILATGSSLKADVLKVGHHGSGTATSYPFLNEVMPTYAVIEVGKGNDYGHPHEETLSKLRDADVTVFRTDLQGSIICTSDGTNISFTTEKTSSSAALNPTAADGSGQNGNQYSQSAAQDSYIGNVNSFVYHVPTCSSLPKEQNRVYFNSAEEAEKEGYTPCSRCIGN